MAVRAGQVPSADLEQPARCGVGTNEQNTLKSYTMNLFTVNRFQIGSIFLASAVILDN